METKYKREEDEVKEKDLGDERNKARKKQRRKFERRMRRTTTKTKKDGRTTRHLLFSLKNLHTT